MPDPDEDAVLDRRTGDPRFVQRLFDEIPFVVAAFEGPELRIAATTAAYRAFTGREGVLGTPLREAFSGSGGRQVVAAVERCYTTGEAVALRDLRIADAAVNLTVRSRRGRDGRVSGVVAEAVDVVTRAPERQAAQARADEAERRYERARDVIDALQRELLPAGVPVLPGVEVAASYLLADVDTAAGGDWFDALALPDGRLALIVGDVVGHGVSASAAMGQLRALLSDRLADTGDIGLALEAADRTAERVRGARWATVCVVVLDPVDGTVSYCTAGHPPPLVVPADGEPRFLAPTGAGPLASGAEFTLGHDRLHPGDLVLLYTDGILERPGRDLASTSVELAQVVSDVAGGRALPPGAPTAVERVCTQAMELLTGATGHSDDVTLLAAQRVAAVENLAVRLAAVPEALAALRSALAGWLAACHVGEEDALALQHTINELATNVVEHAYRDAPAPGPVSVTATLSRTGELHAEVRDEGSWREPHPTPDRGRGLTVATGLVDELVIEHPSGTTAVSVRTALTRPARWLAPDAFRPPSPPGARRADVPALVLDEPAPGRLRVVGPVDTVTAPALAVELLRATAAGTRPLTVDLAGVTHLTSAGVSVLHEADARSLAGGSELRMFAPPGSPAHQILVLVSLPHVTLDADGPG